MNRMALLRLPLLVKLASIWNLSQLVALIADKFATYGPDLVISEFEAFWRRAA